MKDFSIALSEAGPNEQQIVLPPPKPSRKAQQISSPATSQLPLSLSSSVEKPSVAARLAAVAAKEHNGASPAPLREPSRQQPQHAYRSSLSIYPLKPRYKPHSIIPLSKVKSNVGATLSGTIPIDNLKKGVYVFIWDNTTSVLLPKIVSFRIGLVTTALVAATGSSLAADSVDYEVSSPVVLGANSGLALENGEFVAAHKE
ncbi:hypothetical protein HK100_012232 [Physocladia obscura]|uniref:Uncharacterized protein n=1 Tax=Physocladia obscura TaxID=109957 RepID=A0AAD5XCM5_9FUNG|nr:hypothetical protein HK100_012232 [Physocladia obscura]